MGRLAKPYRFPKQFSPWWSTKKKTKRVQRKKDSSYILESKDILLKDEFEAKKIDSFSQTEDEPINIIVTYEPTFETQTQLNHLRYNCFECPSTFQSNWGLLRHVKRRHQKEKKDCNQKEKKDTSTQTDRHQKEKKDCSAQTDRDHLFEKYMSMYKSDVEKFQFFCNLNLSSH